MAMIYVFYNNDPLAQDQGGGAEHFRALLRTLLASGLPFRLVAARLQQEREAGHVEYITDGTGFLRFWAATWLWFWRNRRRFGERDVFHFHRNYAAWPKYLLLPRRGRVVITYHNVSGRVLAARLGRLAPPVRAVMRWFERRAVRRADALICVSGRDRDELARRLAPEPFARALVIPASVDAKAFQCLPPPAPEQAFRILFLGRLSHQKNPILAIAVLEELRRRGLPFTLTLVGDGELQRALIARLARSPARAHIRWLGRVPHDRVPALLAEHGILLLTSRFEASPTVVKEALCAGRPVVTTDVGDVRLWVEEGRNGYICPMEAGALADGVCAASRLVREGRVRRSNRVLAGAEEEVMGRVVELYRRLLAG